MRPPLPVLAVPPKELEVEERTIGIAVEERSSPDTAEGVPSVPPESGAICVFVVEKETVPAVKLAVALAFAPTKYVPADARAPEVAEVTYRPMK